MFAYCGNNPATGNDASGCRPVWENNLREYTDTGTGANERIYKNGAITITVSNNSITIEANITFSGRLNPDVLKKGIKDYWEGTYLIGGEEKTVSIVFHSTISNSISVCSTAECNTSETKSTWCGYETTTVIIHQYYKSGRKKNIGWTMAHEFGHCLGVADYNGYKPPDGTPLSIMNTSGAHASNEDMQMVIDAFRTGKHQVWGD